MVLSLLWIPVTTGESYVYLIEVCVLWVFLQALSKGPDIDKLIFTNVKLNTIERMF